MAEQIKYQEVDLENEDLDENNNEEYVDEETEQLDELSPETLRSYQKKADKSIDKQQKIKMEPGSPEAKARSVKSLNRMGGIERSKEKELSGTLKSVMKDKKMKEDIDADIDAIFSGEGLSEEFKSNAKAIFEAAVAVRVEEEVDSLEEQYAQKLEESQNEFSANLVDKVDEYLDYVVSEWQKENEVAIQNNLKAEIAEDFMIGIKNLFVENYIDIPDDKLDLVNDMAEKLNAAEQDLDKKIQENSNIVDQLNDYKKDVIVANVTEGLTEVQVEKLRSIAENIEFISEEDYKEKLTLTKKKYFESVKEESNQSIQKDGLDSDASTLEESYNPFMEKYVRNISKIVKR